MVLDQFNRQIRDLRISVTDRCNFRCSYCMPDEVFGAEYRFLPREQILSFEEIIRLSRLYSELGVRKIRLTGGEPLLRRGVAQLIEGISRIKGVEDLALTTNGYLLHEKAVELRAAGLQRLTISLDTLNPVLFRQLAGKHLDLEHVLRGIETAGRAGFTPIKLNTVVQKGINDQELVELARFARSNGFIIRFIEFMDVGTLNEWRLEKVMPISEIVQTVTAVFPANPVAKHYRGEVANRYRYLDGKGEFGVISSVSQPFCGACTRVRLTADGQLYTCLFGETGHDIRAFLRDGSTDEQLLQRLSSIWRKRTERYSEDRAGAGPSGKKVEMYRIGG